MRKTALMLLICLMATGIVFAQAPEDKARFAAEQWIVLVDDGQYQESWKEAAKLFQDAVTSSDWESRAKTDRSQLGQKQSRKLKELKATSAVKGLPAGQYYQVKYQSSYEKRKLATETIIAVMEADGTWKVASYSIN